MSEIRRGRHTVTVHPRTKTIDRYGETISTLSTEGHTIQCNVQPLSAEETLALGGGVVQTGYRIKYWPQEHGHVPWPGGPYSQITIDGEKYEQRGEPLQSRMSGTTGHTKIIAVKYHTEPK